jgi:hypothetical protein
VLGICVVMAVALHFCFAAQIFPLFWFIPSLLMSIETANFVLIVISDSGVRRRAASKRGGINEEIQGQVNTTETNSGDGKKPSQPQALSVSPKPADDLASVASSIVE